MTAHDLPEFTAAIVAGGQARRLGRNRQCPLAIGGRSILDRQRDLLRDLTTHLPMVTRKDRQPPATDISVVRDRIPRAGALGGPSTASSPRRSSGGWSSPASGAMLPSPALGGAAIHPVRRTPSRGTAPARLHPGRPAEYPERPAAPSVRQIGPDEQSALDSHGPPALQREYAGRLRAPAHGTRGTRPS